MPRTLRTINNIRGKYSSSPSSLETSKGDEESVPSHILKEIGRLEAESSCISNVFFQERTPPSCDEKS